MSITDTDVPISVGEMLHFREYAEKHDTFGIFVDEIVSDERIRKWNTGIPDESSDKPCLTIMSNVLRHIGLYAVVSRGDLM